MPYFHVEISNNKTTQFVVNASDKDAATDLAVAALNATQAEFARQKHVVKLHNQQQSSVAVAETDKAAWFDTVKKAKAK